MTIDVNYDALIRLCGAASTEATRYYLNGVNVRRRHNTAGVVIEATDGHILAMEHDSLGRVENASGNAIISTPAIVAIKRAVKLYHGGRKVIAADVARYRVTIDGEGFSVTDATGRELVKKTPHQVVAFVDGQFPDCERVIPKARVKDFPRAYGAFNAELIAQLAGTAPHTTASPHMAIYQSDAEAPAMMRVCGAPNWFGVIMPCRIAGIEDGARPTWFYGERAARTVAEKTTETAAADAVATA
jgi:hypothetical protein